MRLRCGLALVVVVVSIDSLDNFRRWTDHRAGVFAGSWQGVVLGGILVCGGAENSSLALCAFARSDATVAVVTRAG